MPIEYSIEHERRLVWAAGQGVLTDADIVGYQREVWSRCDVAGYDEVLDMSVVDRIALPPAGRVQQLAVLAASMAAAPSRLAIVAAQDLAFGLGRMYEAHRHLSEKGSTHVRVVRTVADALIFLGLPANYAAPDKKVGKLD